MGEFFMNNKKLEKEIKKIIKNKPKFTLADFFIDKFNLKSDTTKKSFNFGRMEDKNKPTNIPIRSGTTVYTIDKSKNDEIINYTKNLISILDHLYKEGYVNKQENIDNKFIICYNNLSKENSGKILEFNLLSKNWFNHTIFKTNKINWAKITFWTMIIIALINILIYFKQPITNFYKNIIKNIPRHTSKNINQRITPVSNHQYNQQILKPTPPTSVTKNKTDTTKNTKIIQNINKIQKQ